ncbi:related to beta-1,4-mannosyl-glycoprotein 4-beta-N-acetylglucosaminyltransferase [Cephalotrichum gorgonifer]|uniref:Related to beta-1,4-mannosyl-glycoprotein 4-beta-N-acetylglucosaminyltransferase n=1 Tax=Cephalotrichum gorgonifer TaxID=2041049 RepID=A0AAE8SQT2_9PEZI|nr:related to beta-1,4-mannosyl-glycoprotein 4-beta-N-acetylglucosaminyltransferase [Cephalotrichum gorgonifer]
MILRSRSSRAPTWLKGVCIFVAVFVTHSVWGRGAFDRHIHRISASDRPWALSEGDLPDASAAAICRRQGWSPFVPRAGAERRKVYDLIMVNNEVDWLEIRLNTTFDYVDYFVVVEAGKTFTGHPKPMAIRDNMDRLARYKSKLIYHELEYPPNFDPPRTWDREDLQRDATFTQVLPRLKGEQVPTLGDVLVVADVDEIVRPETLTTLRHCEFPRRLTLRSQFYYYSYQFRHRVRDWPHPEATFFDGRSTVLPTNLRNGDGGLQPLIYWDKADMENAGWHCSSCFRTLEELLDKMGSFSHTWMNRKKYRDPQRIVDRISQGRDIWDRKGEEFDRVEGNSDVPSFVLESERFRYLLGPGENGAVFEDYP